MLAGGASTTGTLEWDTTGEPEAEYTATVLSDDDSDSVMVEIGTAIPDSAVSQYRIVEGSGTTLNNEFDGQPNATISGATWISNSELSGGWGLDFDGTDIVTIDDFFDFVGNGEQFAFTATVNFSSLADNQVIWQQSNDTDDYIFTVGAAGDGNSIGAAYFPDSGDRVEVGNTNATTDRLRVGVNFDAVNDEIDVAINGEISNDNNERPTQRREDSNTLGANNGDEGADMILDNTIWYDGLLTGEEFEQDYQSQPWV